MASTDYSASFDILASDFRKLIEYVEPTDANLPTHSHRLFEVQEAYPELSRWRVSDRQCRSLLSVLLLLA
jgi:hypothetical protein